MHLTVIKSATKKHTVSTSDLKYRAALGLVEITVEGKNFYRNGFSADCRAEVRTCSV